MSKHSKVVFRSGHPAELAHTAATLWAMPAPAVRHRLHPADGLFFDQVRQAAVSNEKLQEAAQANTIDNFRYVFEGALEDLFIQRMEDNEGIFRKLMSDDRFRKVASDYLLREVCNRINRKEGQP